MKNKEIQTIVFNAVIAAIYVVLTLVFAPFSYSTKLLFIELRISEILLLLTFYNKKYGPGIILGCLIANLLGSDLGVLDWVFGTLQTALSVLTFYLIKKLPLNNLLKIIIGSLINSLHCGIIIGGMITYTSFNALITLEKFIPLFAINFLGVFIGELIILIIGTIIFEIAFKNKSFKLLLEIEN